MLTDNQRNGIKRLTDIIAEVRDERKIFGIAPREIDVLEEGHYLPRFADTWVGKGERVARKRGRGDPHRKVGVGKVGEAEAAGTRYKSVLDSVDAYVANYLRRAADKHVASLMAPASKSWKAFLTPAVKTRLVGLRRQARELRESGIPLDGMQAAAIRAFEIADTPNMGAFRTMLRGIRKPVGGPVASRRARQELLQGIKKEVNSLTPMWARERNQLAWMETNLIAGNKKDMQGMFSAKDLSRIASHYSGRRNSFTEHGIYKTMSEVNRAVRFSNATLDLSALFRQQATAAARYPARYAINVMKSFRDVVDRRAYDRLLVSPIGRRFASRGGAIFGNAGDLAEFQASSWLERIPSVKQFNDHFIRFNTRQRIELFALEVDRLNKRSQKLFKRDLTPSEEDAIASAINRTTGVSKTRGYGFQGVLERDGLFAARYTRSVIEEVVNGVANREIEGEIARRYIAQLTAVVTALATTVAVSQKRPLSDVLDPIQVKTDGRMAFNPNFLSVRFFGHDVKPMGAYDSLARIIAINADGTYGAISEKSMSTLFESLGYVIRTKGSPMVSFITDWYTGETFTGEDPLAPGALGRRVMPFGMQTAVEDWSRGMAFGDVVGGYATEALGAKTSPLSFSDYSDEYAREKYGSKYKDLEPLQRDIVQDEIEAGIQAGKIPRRRPPSGYWASVEETNTDQDRKLAVLVQQIRGGLIKDRSVADQYYTIVNDARVKREEAAVLFGEEWAKLDPNEPDLNKRALALYYSIWDLKVKTGQGEFTLQEMPWLYGAYRDQWEAEMLASGHRDALLYVYRNTNRRDIPAEILERLPLSTQRRVSMSRQAREEFLKSEQKALEAREPAGYLPPRW